MSDMIVHYLGFYDIVLGVQWLVSIRDIIMNFNQLTMKFKYGNKNHLLKGETSKLKIVNVKYLSKMAKCDAQLFMVKVISTNDLEK